MTKYKITYYNFDDSILMTIIVDATSDRRASCMAKFITITYSYFSVYEV